jgi:hypothetical protein
MLDYVRCYLYIESVQIIYHKGIHANSNNVHQRTRQFRQALQ